LRGDLEAEDLAQHQAEWLLGRNPFSASIMYGEGYDWTPLYSVRSGQMVGAIPVGIETKEYNDAPYWPTQICWTYKEVWTQPVGEWIWLMQDLHGAPVVEGDADVSSREPIEFRDQRTGRLTQVAVDPANGKFRAQLPQGRYSVRQGVAHTTLTALSGGVYQVDLRASRAFDFNVSVEPTHANELTLRIHAEGAGVHTLEVKTQNLEFHEPSTQTIELRPGHDAELVRHARILASGTPWVIVVIPDGSLGAHREVTGINSIRK
jgi:hypothetical protein